MARDDKRREYVREQMEAAVLGGYEDEKQVLASIQELAWHETAGRPLGPWTARALRDAILRHLPAA